ncbi:Xanthine permease XanP [Sporomusa ovata DSM 2662]|uniref:Xanthine/uracil/vitamin C permease n=1 Tax=Sporomusa ovata TaxID=2378 RepID=A0A0U1L5S1_9FIRM|nr:solute carrier family 23 protein [Sporomusa ovata]EQB28525.1 xanthine/uracil permease [Sporomusa ovata DSM 2662]CQR74855.1 Xanthine/uracil/vitamin C permease [Sporomusa ovata]
MDDNEKKPVNISYGLHDKIPNRVAIPLVIQQIVVLSMDLVLPVLIISMMGGSREVAQNFVSVMMIGIGLGTLLQVAHKGAIGSGYFCAEETGFLYYQASALAVQTGGLPLLFGMTTIAGFFQMLISRIIPRIRFLFPTEVAGLMVAMTGIAGIAPGVAAIFGIDDTKTTIDMTSMWVGIIILVIMVSLNIWGKASMRQYSIFIGIVMGYVLSYICGILNVDDIKQVVAMPYIAIPVIRMEWSFDGRLLLPFLVAVICSTLKTIGNLAICQKTNDANWKRVDVNNVGKGIFAEGIGTSFCGIIGCMGLNSSSGSVGLAIVNGVTSRRLAYLVSSVFIAMAFFPKAAAFLAIMPAPVMGAVLLINLGYFIIEGFQIITSRMLDQRKIFVIGLSLVFGLSVDLLPGIYAQFPVQLQALFKSSLAVVSITAVLLNLLFRIGIKQKSTIALMVGPNSTAKLIDFMEANGAAWGARSDVIHRASSAIIEFFETASGLELVKEGKVRLKVSFDEYHITVNIIYNGVLLEFPEKRPTDEELLNDDTAIVKLSGFLMRKYSNKIESCMKGKNCSLQFHFEH